MSGGGPHDIGHSRDRRVAAFARHAVNLTGWLREPGRRGRLDMVAVDAAATNVRELIAALMSSE